MDNSDRRLRERRASLRELQELQARQEAILESTTDGIVAIGASGAMESLNSAVCEMTGYDRAELLRREIGTLFDVASHKGGIPIFTGMSHQSHVPSAIKDLVGRRKDGTLFPCQVSISPVALATKGMFVVIIRDVSERHLADQMKTEFISTVSHELRTPLTSIAGSLALLSGGVVGELPEQVLKLIRIAHSNSERLVRLVNDMLDIQKMESGAMKMKVKPLPLKAQLVQSLETMRSFAESHAVKIHLGHVPTNSVVLADPDRLTQVVTNLVSNAIKFSPPDHAVQVSVQLLGPNWRISVGDKGPGIPHEFRSRIFNKFAQADSTDSRRRGGTGLGLSIVREIVTRLSGSVSYDSEIGKGTTFHIDLPAQGSSTIVQPDFANHGSRLRGEDDLDVVAIAPSGRIVATQQDMIVKAGTALGLTKCDRFIP